MSKVDFDVQRIAYQIEQYLIQHPNAADAIEGVSKWWLLSKGQGVSNELVQQALDFLCEQKILKCNTNIGDNKIYSRY